MSVLVEKTCRVYFGVMMLTELWVFPFSNKILFLAIPFADWVTE